MGDYLVEAAKSIVTLAASRHRRYLKPVIYLKALLEALFKALFEALFEALFQVFGRVS
jgi:hypothetical protein